MTDQEIDRIAVFVYALTGERYHLDRPATLLKALEVGAAAFDTLRELEAPVTEWSSDEELLAVAAEELPVAPKKSKR